MEDWSQNGVMPFEMKNLTSFPMEQLCFDLKLEMLEQMGAKDVVELTKVNQGFQEMLVKDPSIVFGQHVSWIQLCTESIRIWKFSNSDPMKLNVNLPFSHFSFVKRIRACGHLWLGSDSKEVLERFFSNFHASIKEAGLSIVFDVTNEEEDDDADEEYDGDEVDPMIFERGIKDLIEDFIVARLKDCEKIEIGYDSEDLWSFYYNALLRTQIKNVVVNDVHGGCIDLIAQQIVTNGIPSKNPEAAIFIHSHKCGLTMDLSQYPEMRRIGGKNCRARKNCRLLKQANYLVKNFGWSHSDGSGFFLEKSSMFRRRIDSAKECIYVYSIDACTYFLAFYVPAN